MNCYFCHGLCQSRDPVFTCYKHPVEVHHGADPLMVFFNQKKKLYEPYIIIYLYPPTKKCVIRSTGSFPDIAHFDFLPDITPENFEEKLKTILTFL